MALLSTIMVSVPLTPESGLAPQTLALLFRELLGPPVPPSPQGRSQTVTLGRDRSSERPCGGVWGRQAGVQRGVTRAVAWQSLETGNC